MAADETPTAAHEAPTTALPGDAVNESGAILSLRDVHKSFGNLRVLAGVDLEVQRGTVTCVIGPSGSGKSTLLRCINLLAPPEQGSIMLEGKEIAQNVKGEDLDYVRQRVGMVFQQFNLFPHMSAIENVSIAQRKVLGRSESEASEKARRSFTALAWRTRSRPTRTASRAASSSASPSPGRWRWSRT